MLLKFTLPLGYLAVIVVRAAWVRLPEPDGIEVSRADAPALHKLVDELRASLDVKPIDRLLIVDDLNAAVAQTPRWGLFGPQRSALLIGLPLLQALPEAELRAVLAHELGHLSGNHSRFAGRVYQLRATWSKLLVALETSRHRGAWIFRRFFEWYAPYFSAYTFALARDDEYVADGASAEAAGPAAAASALVRLHLADRFEDERHWTPLFDHIADRRVPPRDAISARGPRLRAAADDPDAKRWLTGALARRTDHTDTHPALGDRLTALGVPPGGRVEPFDGPSAAEALLGPLEHALAARFDAEWLAGNAAPWTERHEELQAARARVAELAGRDDLAPDDAFERALIVRTLDGEAAAAPLLEALVASEPEDARARYALGTLRLGEGSDEGLTHLDEAIRLEREAILPACAAAIPYLEERGRTEEAARYHDLARRESGVLEHAYAQRSRFDPDDPVRLCEPTPEQRDALRAALAGEREVSAAYLAEKDVPPHPGVPPLLILGLRVHRPMYRFTREDADARLADRLAERLDLGAPFCIVPLDRAAKRLRKRLERGGVPAYARSA